MWKIGETDQMYSLYYASDGENTTRHNQEHVKSWRKVYNWNDCEVSLKLEKGKKLVNEYNDAWKFLISWEQKKLDIKKQKSLQCSEIQVEMSSNRKLTHIILAPRIKNFPVSFSSQGNLLGLIAPHRFN